MSMQTGSIDADGLARTSDGKLYVTLGSGSTIDTPTFTGVAAFADGAANAPSIARSASATGFYFLNSTTIGVSHNGVGTGQFGSTFWLAPTTLNIGATDLALVRDGAANTLAQKNGNADQISRSYSANGGYWERGSVSELLTLSTGGTTTDTAANLLPANAIIEAVTARVTTTVATATSWQLGDATVAGRFTAAQSGAQLTAGATVVGLVHIDLTGTSGPRQTAAAKLRVTTVGTPSAGVIRITSYYRAFVPATS